MATNVKWKFISGCSEKRDFEVSDEGYFLYVNGSDDPLQSRPNRNLSSDYAHRVSWAGHLGQNTLSSAKACLIQEQLPDSGHECDNCSYYSQRSLQEISVVALS